MLSHQERRREFQVRIDFIEKEKKNNRELNKKKLNEETFHQAYRLPLQFFEVRIHHLIFFKL
jgi:hypothetical protein